MLCAVSLCSDSAMCSVVFWQCYVWCHCVLTMLCAVSLCSDIAMCSVVFWQCYVWCRVLAALCGVSLCSDNAMCGVIVFWQCYVRCRCVLTLLCAVALCSDSDMCGSLCSDSAMHSVYFSCFLVPTLGLWLNSLRLDAPSSFDICGVTSPFLNLCSSFLRVSRYQNYKQAVALAVRSNAGSIDTAVPSCQCLLTVVTEHRVDCGPSGCELCTVHTSLRPGTPHLSCCTEHLPLFPTCKHAVTVWLNAFYIETKQ